MGPSELVSLTSPTNSKANGLPSLTTSWLQVNGPKPLRIFWRKKPMKWQVFVWFSNWTNTKTDLLRCLQFLCSTNLWNKKLFIVDTVVITLIKFPFKNGNSPNFNQTHSSSLSWSPSQSTSAFKSFSSKKRDRIKAVIMSDLETQLKPFLPPMSPKPLFDQITSLHILLHTNKDREAKRFFQLYGGSTFLEAAETSVLPPFEFPSLVRQFSVMPNLPRSF